MTPEARRAFANALYQRRGEGVRLRTATPIVEGWQPTIHECYENVDYWVSLNRQHKRVNGFVFFNELCVLGFALFNAHCVIEDENGVLVDITPHEATNDYLFIRHIGTDAEFEILAEAGQIRLELP